MLLGFDSGLYAVVAADSNDVYICVYVGVGVCIHFIQLYVTSHVQGLV